MGDVTYYRVDSLRDGTVPIGLFRINHNTDGDITSFDSFNRRTGKWVDDPDLGAYVYKGEPGATRITDAEAAQLEQQLLRQ
ncbi:MAG: hypothetical protein QOE72_3805 [Chloroflexota bacterium]|nr:hypothetical protein [Chloroflexota bacterium]